MENETITVNEYYGLIANLMNGLKEIIIIRLKKYQLMNNVSDLFVINELNMVLNLMDGCKNSFNKGE